MLNALALKLVAGTAAILMLVVLVMDRNHWKHVAADRQAQLVALEKQSKESQSKVETRIVEGKTRTVYVDRVAKQIEEAPLPGNCASPTEVLNADI